MSFLTEYNASFSLFINLMILAIPNLLPLVIIISLIISVINTYNKLLNNNELVILKNAGLSKKKLIGPIIYFSFLLSITCFLILSYLVPYSNKEFRNTKDDIYGDILNTAFNKNNFNSINNITFYAKERINNKLKSVIVSIQNKDKNNTIYAKEAIINKNIINFSNGNISISNNGENNIIYFDNYNFNLGNFYNRNESNDTSIEVMNLNELLKLKVSKDDKKNYTKYLSQIYLKVSMSILCFAMGIFSGTLILDKSFSRRNSLYTVFVSILSIILFVIIVYLIKNGSDNIRSIYIGNLMSLAIILFSVINLNIKK